MKADVLTFVAKRRPRSLLSQLQARHRCSKDADAGFEQLAPKTNARHFLCLGCGASVIIKVKS